VLPSREPDHRIGAAELLHHPIQFPFHGTAGKDHSAHKLHRLSAEIIAEVPGSGNGIISLLLPAADDRISKKDPKLFSRKIWPILDIR
jgi:hypothetical protein